MRYASGALVLTLGAQAFAQSTITGKNLRIMPLGDSITVGACGYNGNGYRQNLTNMLEGNQVNIAGQFRDGTARDQNFEAQGGFYIDQIQNLAINSLGSLPNVYLVHAGTNNLYSNMDCAPAGTGNSSDPCQAAVNALSSLLNTLYYTGALLVVAQIGPSLNTSYTGRMNVYNQLVANLVNSKKPSDGWKLQLANMQSQLTTNDFDPTCGGSNIVHPTPGGYQKMANVWYNALVNASNFNLIPSPRIPYGYAYSQCTANPPSTQVWSGSQNVYYGRGQANFFYGLQCSDVSGTNNCTCNDGGSSNTTVAKTGSCAEMSLAYTSASRFADLNGDGRLESVWISSTGALNTSLNLGIGTWPLYYSAAPEITSNFRELGLISVPANPAPTRYQVRLADVDGDGRAEYIIVNSDGSATGYYNIGSPHVLDNAITVNFSSQAVQTAPSFGVPGAGVRFADFDGDGKADYIYVANNGSIQVWLNQNSANTANVGNNWSSQGSVGPMVPTGTKRENVIFADLDGDGRSDYLIVNRTDGSVAAYMNKPPPSGSNTPSWNSVGVVVSAQNASQAGAGQFLSETQFADVDGDGHSDYLVVGGGNSAVQGLYNGCY